MAKFVRSLFMEKILNIKKSSIIKKSFCDFSKEELKQHKEGIITLISNPKYYCKKCVRVSSKKDFLCKPKNISPNSLQHY